jgi:hypothetical protein
VSASPGFEIRVDCPACRVESARVETWNAESPGARLGLPDTVRCALCGHAAEARVELEASPFPGDGCPKCGAALDDASRGAHSCPFCGCGGVLEETRPGVRFDSDAELATALDAWARTEGLASGAELVEAYFVLPDTAQILAALSRGDAVETTFDVTDYLFSSGGGGGGGDAGRGQEVPVLRKSIPPPPVTMRMSQPVSIRPTGGPREELLALASVAAADGEASFEDQQVLLRAASRRGVVPLEAADMRVWRPNEIPAPSTLVDRERVLEEMLQLAWADGQLDASELRVIRDFARAWGIDPQRVQDWIQAYDFGASGTLERWLRRFAFFLFPAR